METLKPTSKIKFRRTRKLGYRPNAKLMEEGELFINLTDRTISTSDGEKIIDVGGGGGGASGLVQGPMLIKADGVGLDQDTGFKFLPGGVLAEGMVNTPSIVFEKAQRKENDRNVNVMNIYSGDANFEGQYHFIPNISFSTATWGSQGGNKMTIDLATGDLTQVTSIVGHAGGLNLKNSYKQLPNGMVTSNGVNIDTANKIKGHPKSTLEMGSAIFHGDLTVLGSINGSSPGPGEGGGTEITPDTDLVFRNGTLNGKLVVGGKTTLKDTTVDNLTINNLISTNQKTLRIANPKDEVKLSVPKLDAFTIDTTVIQMADEMSQIQINGSMISGVDFSTGDRKLILNSPDNASVSVSNKGLVYKSSDDDLGTFTSLITGTVKPTSTEGPAVIELKSPIANGNTVKIARVKDSADKVYGEISVGGTVDRGEIAITTAAGVTKLTGDKIIVPNQVQAASFKTTNATLNLDGDIENGVWGSSLKTYLDTRFTNLTAESVILTDALITGDGNIANGVWGEGKNLKEYIDEKAGSGEGGEGGPAPEFKKVWSGTENQSGASNPVEFTSTEEGHFVYGTLSLKTDEGFWLTYDFNTPVKDLTTQSSVQINRQTFSNTTAPSDGIYAIISRSATKTKFTLYGHNRKTFKEAWFKPYP